MKENSRLVDGDGGYSGGGSSRVKIIVLIVVVVIALAVLFIVLGLTVWKAKSAAPYQLWDHVQVDNVLGHLSAFQGIATNSSGSRAVQFGYNASAQYVMEQLANRDFTIYTQPFTVPVYTQLANPTLYQTLPIEYSFVYGTDFIGTRYGGNQVGFSHTAEVSLAGDVGCLAADYISGGIALVFNNANCTQYDKAIAASQAGVAALLIANAPGATTLSNWRVRSVDWVSEEATPLVQIPVLSVSYTVGSLLTKTTSTVTLTASSQVIMEPTYNVFALTKSGSSEHIVVAGAHLDGVPEGPGINDNGSGSTSLLEIALQTGPLELSNKVLFAWWGAEEIGLLGSRYFVTSLVNGTNLNFTLPQIALDLNFDMLGSPNYILQVHNASTIANPVSINASIVIQNLFVEYFTNHNIRFAFTPMTGGSDYLPFVDAGVPAGGLATGAGGIKSSDERHEYGGIANAAYDPCYHQACDSFENVDSYALGTLAQAAAYVIQNLGQQPDLVKFLWGTDNVNVTLHGHN